MEFLVSFDKNSSLEIQNFWTGFHLDPEVITKYISELLTKGSPRVDWGLISKLGRDFVKNGKPSTKITECVPT